ncbi:glycosyltransferase [Rhizobium sp. NRK18]|uniref:glycosyltransferase n=1 Tax=Rhizobium sp. NRK18 TaxID=2964667 RepID=UPI0021C2D1DB|nr:glycosyltransferase [Rhizobium sp. NRK18]
MNKRIVFHVPTLGGGGAERVFVLMANEMAARGHAVTLLVWSAKGPNAELCDPRVRLISLDLPVVEGGFGKAGTLKGLARSAAFLRREQPDVVFSGPSFANLIMALALAAGASRAAFFPSFHAAASLVSNSIGSRIATAAFSLVVRRATRLIAVSEGVGRDLFERGAKKERITVIHNPLTPSSGMSGPYPWRETLAAMGGGPVIITLGRLIPLKDHRTLLKAFSRLDPVRGYRLVVFGDGPLKDSLVAEAERLGIAERTLFPGYVKEPDACYACADLFVLSSVSEGFGNVLVEAMAAGVPVVSTDAPHGPREILADGRFGALVPVGDAAALAAAIEETLARPPAADELRARAADFSIDIVGDRYEALLKDV